MKVHRNCCGLDVHKQTIAACLIREDGMGNTCKEKRLFGTMTRDLRVPPDDCSGRVDRQGKSSAIYPLPCAGCLEIHKGRSRWGIRHAAVIAGVPCCSASLQTEQHDERQQGA